MSAAQAFAVPQNVPQNVPQSAPQHARPRHIEIVTTRAQRRSRPRSFYATIAVTSVFTLLLAQLLLSIVLSDGAYQISALQNEQKQLARTQQALDEQLDLLASPQSLAARAESLGMVLGTNAPVFLRLSDGVVSGTPTPAAGTAGAIGADGSLVANALLTQTPDLTADPGTDGNTVGSTAGGAPSAGTANASVPSNNGQLPSPQTR
jgi:hypothetical protein